MPVAFENCVKKGGRVRRKTLSGNRYINICFIGGKSYAGETHTKKGSKAKTSPSIEAAMKKATFHKKP